MKSRRAYLWSVLIVLLLSIQSLKSLPWGPHWGLDFQNLHAFHHGCRSPMDPYIRSGLVCGDELGRDLYYPPVMYWSFFWTRWLSFQAAYTFWCGFMLAVLAFSFRTWARPTRESPWLWAIGLLMLFQYPTVFALERGNNDVWVLLFWSLAYLAFQSGRNIRSGAWTSLAALSKVYPIFAAIVVLAGCLRPRDHKSRKLILGFALATGAALLATLPSTMSYLTLSLPRFSQTRNAPGLANHAVIPFFSHDHEWIGYLLAATPLALWISLSLRAQRRDPALVFAGALALTTYFSGVSEDYNLLTTYPLLFLLAARALREPLSAGFYKPLSFAGFLAVMGHRQIFVGTSVFFQLAWLAVVALATHGRLNATSPKVFQKE